MTPSFRPLPLSSRAAARTLRAGLGALSLSVAQAGEPARWERLAPLPTPTGGFIAGVVGGQLIVAGGTNWTNETKRWLDRIWTYDSAGNTWRETGRFDSPVAYAVAGCDATALWFAGGTTGAATRRSLWRLGPDLAPKQIAAFDDGVVLGSGAILGSRLYAVGGTRDEAHLDQASGAFVSVDVVSGATTRLADYPEPSFLLGAAAACGDRLFVFGGARWDPASKQVVNLATAHSYSVPARRWKTLPSLPTGNRGISAVTLDERHIFLAGGYTDKPDDFTADAFIYDTAAASYTRSVPLPYKGLVGLVTQGDWIYCLGGEDMKKHRSDAVYRLRWRQLLPSRR